MSGRQATFDVFRLPHHVSGGDTQFPQPGAQAVFRGGRSKRAERAERCESRALDAATRPEQLNLPGFQWHARQGVERWTIRVSGNSRITLWLGWRRCGRRRFGGLPLTPSIADSEPRTGTGLPAMHPGELLREDILPALGRPRVEVARLLGVSRQALHAVLAERAAVRPTWHCGSASCAATVPRCGLPSRPATILSGSGARKRPKLTRSRPYGRRDRSVATRRHPRTMAMTEAGDRAPQWDVWKHVPAPKLWECIALSLNIDPRKVRHHPEAWMTGGPGRPPVPVFCEAQSFKGRWFLVQKALGTTLAGPVNPVAFARGADPVVNIHTFARWACSVEWEMPASCWN